jgi:hypothetical protein
LNVSMSLNGSTANPVQAARDRPPEHTTLWLVKN